MRIHNDYPAFIIIECMMFIVCTMIMCILVMQFLATVHQTIGRVVYEVRTELQMHSVLHAVADILTTAPAQRRDWLSVQPSLLIWHDHHGIDWGLSYEDGALVAYSGKYVMHTRKWDHLKRRTLLYEGASGIFMLHETSLSHATVHAVTIRLATKKGGMQRQWERFVVIKNRKELL